MTTKRLGACASASFLCAVLAVVGLTGSPIHLFSDLSGGLQQAEAQGHSHEPPAAKSPKPAPEPEPEESPPTIEIPPEKQQLIGVKIVEASTKHLRRTIRTVGRIEIDERRLATVNTKFPGWIERLYVDYTGRYVRRGEVLAEIYSPELLAAQQEFIDLLRWRSMRKPESPWGAMLTADADTLLEATKQRLRLWDITEEQIRQIEQTGRPVRTVKILSPVSGYVIQKMAVLGMRVMPGEKLYDVADLSSVWVIADIYEYEMLFVRVGQKARISLSYLPGEELDSRIDFVYPAHAVDTRTMKVRFTIPNPKTQLMPQMFTNVEIKVDLGERLVIPAEAIIDTGTRQIVYVDQGEGVFEPREIMVGLRSGDFVEVAMGLKAGEKLAGSAAFLIDSEAQLKGVAPLGGHKH
jgi:Cu(I)/Ag(I) efflux system membrane fusion protein